MSIVTITILPSLGTLVIPAGVTTSGIKLNLTTGAIASRVPWAASAAPSSCHYDAMVDLSRVSINGNPFVRVTDGPLKDTYVSSAGLILTPPVAPVLVPDAKHTITVAVDGVVKYTEAV